MYKIKKKFNNKKNNIFFKSFFCKIKIFYIDNIILIPIKIKVKNKKNILFFKSIKGKIKYLYINNNINIFLKNNKILLNILLLNKNNLINLYTKIIKNFLKGVLQGFKIILILKGLNFKYKIENKQIFLKLGLSHYIIINIPNNIQVIKQQNKIIFYSINYFLLKQFVFYLHNLKKINIYKEKGLLLQNEKINIKEGKKSKK